MSAKRNRPNKGAKKETVLPHQPGESAFKAILPEEIDWKPFPAFPPSARLAIVVGQPLQEGPYTIRVKVPRGVKLMPHRPPEDRVLPGNTSHFHWAKSGEYITQVTAIGPLGLEYVNSKDDPRSKSFAT